MTMVRAKAPLRLSFAGGGTDHPAYYREHGWAVLTATINRYSFVSLSPRNDDEVALESLDFDLTVKYRIDEHPIYDGILDLAKATIQKMKMNHGFNLEAHTDAPPGSGLGGSSSFTIAMIGALGRLNHGIQNAQEIAELAYTIERDELDIKGGRQDQYAIAFGGFNLIEFLPAGVRVTPLIIERRTLNELEYHLLLCYTGKTHLSGNLIEKQMKFFHENRPSTVQGMHELRKLAYQMKEALLKGDLNSFGELLHESGIQKKRMNPEATDGAIDEMYEVARRNGTVGGKILGAGGGGYLLLFCESNKKRAVREALEKLGGQFTDFSFDGNGLQVWDSECP
jgi:D-glycero-alpha-D-manno-heptose-7-phosphate kinase